MKHFYRIVVMLILAIAPNEAALLWVGSHGLAQNVTQLEPGLPITRTAKNRQADTYQLTLTARQFVRAVAKQSEMNVWMGLIGPDNKPVVASDFNSSFGQESLCWEVSSQTGLD